MSIKLRSLLLLLVCVWATPSLALTPSNSGSGTNTYLFIDNDVDHEYFITSGSLSPRFSGSNVWTKYKTRQRSLGYMGNSGWSYANRYHDLWIANSPISRPFLGIRCMTTGTTCPASGYITPDVIDKDGFYHAMSGSSADNGSYGAGTLSPSAYEYFRSQPVGSSDVFDFNLCYMNLNTDYDFASGERCKDLASGGTWRNYTMTLNKVGHLTLRNTGAVSEIWIASDGTPSVSIGSELCQVGIAGRDSGLVCKMVAYNLQETERLTASLDFQMVIDTALLGFSPSASDVRYSGDASTWYNFGSATTYNKVFTTTGEYVYVFLSSAFFRKMLAAGSNLANKDALFTFFFDNSVTPQSGYYQFTPSTLINIVPKEYGISIIAKDGGSTSTGSGKIGSSTPIELDYKVTVSAQRMADSITAQVVGDSTTINAVPYCLFSSSDGGLQVPIPAYLSWTAVTGAEQKVRNSCSEAPVDMTQANWVATAWNANVDSGSFFTTTLKLLFPMDDSRSKLTVDGLDWMGIVNASGEVKVTATWIGVDR
ncbi:fimbrial protein [Kluyvera cryocrescens]|uniref:fimbrial protein n=1 Tax=Kluyvera cryocrescens TaxID=580 RepID=UPI0028BE17C0|nr:fimbrial protein [Kluyvera cryocrescens]WNN73836.1 fimbrial protein [Kluyvera cryocrescens]